ncbi:MAG: hypothetical protein K0S46_2672 [Moraxellaceae bacterium]|jgi:hypothetical protein|nr:hypothetical protein [Moraxellaceae bacterium]
MEMLYLIFHIGLCIWVIFFGGARVIEGSWLAAFEFHALASARQIKFMAWFSLLLLPVALYFMSHRP